MQKEIDVDGVLSKSIQNTICKKVYEYAKKYSEPCNRIIRNQIMKN